MAQRSSLRASDADREHIAERLRHAAAEGRLLADELEQRLGDALRARTYGELDAVVADLPRDALAYRSSRSALPVARPVIALAIAAAVCAVLVAALLVITGVLVWGVWLLIAWLMFGRRYRHCRRVRRGSQWQVHGVSSHTEPRFWL